MIAATKYFKACHLEKDWTWAGRPAWVCITGFSVAWNGLESLMGVEEGKVLSSIHLWKYNHGFHSRLPLVWRAPMSWRASNPGLAHHLTGELRLWDASIPLLSAQVLLASCIVSRAERWRWGCGRRVARASLRVRVGAEQSPDRAAFSKAGCRVGPLGWP